MSEQMDLGAQLRDAAMDRVATATPPDWREAAESALRDVALLGFPEDEVQAFTSEDVRDELLERGIGDPPEPRAMGPVMSRAHKAGLIMPCGWGTSTRASSHKMPKRKWIWTGRAWPEGDG